MDPETMADRFSLEFVRTHPSDAARVIEQISEDDATPWLNGIPSADAASLLALFAPARARRYLQALDAKRLEQVLSHLSPDLLAALARRMGRDARERVLAAATEQQSESVRTLLRFADGTVGSIMDVHAAVVPQGMSVGALLDLMAQSADETRNCIYLVDGSHALAGMVETRDLLTASRSDSVAGFMRRAEFTLSPRMSLESADEHRGWKRHDELPVVESNHRLLGALSRRVLSDAVHGADDESRHVGITDAVLAVAETVWDAWAEVFMHDTDSGTSVSGKAP
jgi:magnesium transporter